MNDILLDIAANKRREVAAIYPDDRALRHLIEAYDALPPTYSMSASLRSVPGGVIAEFKRRSPSKGDIFPMADVADVITRYVEAGAAACSVLTDVRYFGGSGADLALARTLSGSVPLLRKDFVVSAAQIYQARLLGASAILLIAAILTADELEQFNGLAHTLGMEALVEIHDISELNKINFRPDMLGVNNRNLSSFHTDVAHSMRLISSLPTDTVLVAESGIRNAADLRRLRDVGFTGFLIGEAFMSSPDPGETLKQFINETI